MGTSTGNTKGFQDIIYADTSWLLTSHISEIINFVLYDQGTYKWVMLLPDPGLAWNMLQDEQNAGNGNTLLFEDKTWSGGESAEISINGVLSDMDLKICYILAVI